MPDDAPGAREGAAPGPVPGRAPTSAPGGEPVAADGEGRSADTAELSPDRRKTSVTSQDVTSWKQDGGGASNVKQGSHVIVIGGGPGGYEAALVAAQLGARVTVVERKGMGGSAVLTDVVPSKTLIATAEWLTNTETASELGIVLGDGSDVHVRADLGRVNARVRDLATRQSADIRTRMEREGIEILEGTGRLGLGQAPRGLRLVEAELADGTTRELAGNVVLLATGAHPRTLPDAQPDGERILTWTQLYELDELPEHLVVVGSGVTGAEFASAYSILGSRVTLVSSRDRVLPGHDNDAAELIEEVFAQRGMTVLSRCHANAAKRVGDGVEVTLSDGRVIECSHVLLAVGSVPNTDGLNLQESGVRLTDSGHIEVDRVSRTTISRIYAAGDCTGVLPLASVAAMQGRIAMWHALGDAVSPLNIANVSSNIFTLPEIATVGVTQDSIDSGDVDADTTMLPLSRNPRAKMLGQTDGFYKLFSARPSGRIIGGVVVGQRAGEHIFPITMAMATRCTVDDLSTVFTIYPSLSGSLTEAARVLHDPSPEF